MLSPLVWQTWAWCMSRSPGAEVIYRFIGATPDSSQGHTLLRGLCEELARRGGPGGPAVPTGYAELVTDFRERLASAGSERPLIVFIDSLDQLSDSQGARGLAWLPTPPPEGVHLVLSTRSEDILETLVRRGAQVEELGPMLAGDGRDLLRRWLAEARRRLQPAQEQEVLAKFQASNSNPLYLRLAF
jgi:NACHT domain- and WD repeat-containing protein